MRFDLRHNIRNVQRGLDDVARNQVPFAMSRAINDTLADIVKNMGKRMQRVIDRPTPFTLKAFGMKRAGKRTLAGSVFAKDAQAKYLQWLETGGTRTPKGVGMPVPGLAARVNKYGNLPRGRVGTVLSSGKGFSGSPHAGDPSGVYQRVGKRLRLVAVWVGSATYKPVLGFADTARKTSAARIAGHIAKRLKAAIASAK